jgi:hypothetical protein
MQGGLEVRNVFACPRRQEFYEALIREGAHPPFAESLASWRRFPGSPPESSLGAAGTEQSFFSATEDPLSGVHPFHREYVRKKLAENGATDLNGKKYLAQLANFAGDPAAVVGSRTDIRNVLESRGWGCDGLVKVRAAERDQPLTHESGPYQVAPGLVEERLQAMEQADSEMAALHRANPRARADAFERVSNEMSGMTGTQKRRPEAFEHIMNNTDPGDLEAAIGDER